MRKHDTKQWETPSLEWIHRVRRERSGRRAGLPTTVPSTQASERLANKYGLKLGRHVVAGR